MTSRAAKLVWRRLWESNGEIRTSRCTPRSADKSPKAKRPRTCLLYTSQHVNKTDSAVRLTHLPTGIVVSCQNERSQHQNKARAMQILAAKLAQRSREERKAEIDSIGGERIDNAWGSQIRSYTLAPFQLVKDVRTRVETGNVEAVLDGDIDAFIEAELRRRRAGA